MSHAFGKPIGVAAQVKKGQKVMSVFVSKENIPHARDALKKAGYKLPCAAQIQSRANK
jgi:large subunit ribosomal protein L10e